MTRISVGVIGLALLAGCAQTESSASRTPIDESLLQTVVIKVPGMS